MWYNNPLLKTVLSMLLKKTNQRIVQLAKTFGKNSEIYKQEIKILQTGAARQYLSFSASGNIKIDIAKIMKIIYTGKIERSDLNRLLSEVAGVKVDANGEVQKIANEGIKTVTQIRKAARKRLEHMGEDPSEYSADEVIQMYEDILGFQNTLETAYQAAVARFGEEELKKDPITSRLWSRESGGTRGHEVLTYSELKGIRDQMTALAIQSKRSALSFESDNTNEL